MKKTILSVVLLLSSLAHAQQHGWVRVAQLGNQSTNLQAVEFVDSLHGWVAEGSATTYRTSDGGTSWTPSVVNAPLLVSSISMTNTEVGWCAGSQGTTGRILRTTDGGTNWFQQFFLDNRNYLGTAGRTLTKNNITSGHTRNFSPDTGKVVQTTNGGATWTERSMGTSHLGKVVFVDSLHGWITTDGNVSNPLSFALQMVESVGQRLLPRPPGSRLFPS